MLGPTFELQGHRGARGLKPENTLPSFETALDLGVTAVETDIRLTSDHVPILFHDSHVTERLCRLRPGAAAPPPSSVPAVAALRLADLRAYCADGNPAPGAFPDQDASVTPVATLFAADRGLDPYTPPTLDELFAFCAGYAGVLGQRAGKSVAQRDQAGRLRFDLELKRLPFRDATGADRVEAGRPGLLERVVVAAIAAAGLVARTRIRSFDHRAVAAVRLLEPALTTAVLVAGTAPVAPAELARRAGAACYGPDFEFLDEAQVRQLHAEGVAVLPWTVNRVDDAERLLAWGVDGLTSDFPDRLAGLLRQRGVVF